jgi:carbon monoxide dehydrogenase subunit G
MLMEGKFIVKGSIQKIWDILINPDTLAACVPGSEKIELIGEKTYESVVKQKVGPISIRLKFITTLTEVNPPNHFKAVGKGDVIGGAGAFSQETVADLREISPEDVELSYKSVVSIAGKLATFGDRIMRAKAKQVEQEFTENLNKRLSLVP